MTTNEEVDMKTEESTPRYNEAKYRQIVEDYWGARHKFEAIAEERQALMGQRHGAKRVIEQAEQAANALRFSYEPSHAPTPRDLEDARRVLARLDEVTESYNAASAENVSKRQLVQRLTRFLLDKGVRDPFVLDQIERLEVA
jgi:hypothetical protein